MIDDAVWYLMRGSGVAALLLLTGVVVLGILTARKASLPTLPRFATMELHRSISLVSVLFVLLHVLTAIADPYAQVRLADVLVPFLGASQALWLGLGTLAFDLLAAVVVSSLLMKRIPRTTWRTIHRAGYAAWPLAFLHGIEQGSDGAAIWLRMLAGAALGVVVASAGWRLAPYARGAMKPAPRRKAG